MHKKYDLLLLCLDFKFYITTFYTIEAVKNSKVQRKIIDFSLLYVSFEILFMHLQFENANLLKENKSLLFYKLEKLY